MRYKTFKSIGMAILSCLFIMSSSCVSDFEDINKNPLFPDKEMEQLDGVLNGAFVPTLQKNVIPVGTASDGTDFANKYQVTINLAGDSWAGYHSPRDNKWESGQNFTTFFFVENWNNNTFSWSVTDIFAPWIQLRNINLTGENPNKEMFALAQITKIMALHKTTDKYGPIPYSKVGTGSFTVEYDSQEDVYRSFFAELDEAIEILSAYQISGYNTVHLSSDVVYEGDVSSWLRLANSLMLRLAIRVRFADPELAQSYAEKAVNSPYGLIESAEQAAKMQRGSALQMRNSLKTINEEYNDTRMGATIHSYLKGYNDPRAAVYFSDNGSKAVRAGLPPTGNSYESFSRPIVDVETPTYWIKASEVLFLRAEGALAGFQMGGTPKDLYEAGIKMSFVENGLNPEGSGTSNSYLTSQQQPASYIDAVNPLYSYSAPSSITVPWNDNDTEEQKLERIITQKYLAIYPDGQEAWTEWRRTGYPRQIPPAVNLSNAGVVTSDGHKNGVRRFPYPRTEYLQNNENVQKAIQQHLGGTDNAATNVWWDKKVK